MEKLTDLRSEFFKKWVPREPPAVRTQPANLGMCDDEANSCPFQVGPDGQRPSSSSVALCCRVLGACERAPRIFLPQQSGEAGTLPVVDKRRS